MTQPALELNGVTVRFGSTTALAGVSLALADGSCVAIVGESGSGKTTLLRVANGLVEPDEGEARVRGERIERGNAIALRRRMGYVPQDGGLLPHWNVARNAGLVPRLQQQSADDAAAAGARALQLVGLSASAHGVRWPHELSGGQRQRVALARALAAQPQLLLLDEPFGALDAITRFEVQQTFEQVRRETGVTTLLITHDIAEALRLADRVAVLRAGRIEQMAAPAQLVNAPATDYVRALVERARAAWPAELRS